MHREPSYLVGGKVVDVTCVCRGMLLNLQCFCNLIRNTSRIQLVDLDHTENQTILFSKVNDNVGNKKMEIDAMADCISSIGTMKLTEPLKKFTKEKWRHVEAMMNFDIENAKQLSTTPLHRKDRSHYYISMIQVRLLKEKLRNMEKDEANEVYGEYSKTKDFKDLKRSAGYWSEVLLKQSLTLKAKLKILDQAPH